MKQPRLFLAICSMAIVSGTLAALPIEDFVYVEPGHFTMGLNEGTANSKRFSPAHEVTLTKSFFMAQEEVTVEEFVKVANWAIKNKRLVLSSRIFTDIYHLFDPVYQLASPRNPDLVLAKMYTYQRTVKKVDILSDGQLLRPAPGRERYPVTGVIWLGAIEFCNLKSEMDGLVPYYQVSSDKEHLVIVEQNPASNGYRLPTEAEWEFAARGGVKSKGYTYVGSNEWQETGEYLVAGVFPKGTYPVAQYKPNELGIYDMGGNVSEWVWDIYGEYPKEPATDPSNVDYRLTIEESKKVVDYEKNTPRPTLLNLTRGSSWNGDADFSLVHRDENFIKFEYVDDEMGFRLCKNIPTVLP